MDFKLTDFTNLTDFFEMTKSLKRKRYISPREIRMYCPSAQIVPEFEHGMMTYEIHCDKISEFFSEHKVIRVVVNRECYKSEMPIHFESQTTVIIKCLVEM